MRFVTAVRGMWLGMAIFFATTASFAEEELPAYFDGLRARGLLTVAESYALGRLADPKLEPALRTAFVVELSKTLVAHAVMIGPPQDDELWQQAREVLTEAQQRPELVRGELIAGQIGLAYAAQAAALRQEAELAPFDEMLRDAARNAATSAIKALQPVIAQLDEQLRQGRPRAAQLSLFEARQFVQSLRIALGQALRDRAVLMPKDAPERTTDLIEADRTFRAAFTGLNDPRRDIQAKLGIADVTRLQRNFDSADKMFAALAKIDPPLPGDLRDAVDAVRVRTWLDQGQPLAAAEFLLETRRARLVWQGELWYAQLLTLKAMRQAATERKDAKLADELVAEANAVIEKMDQQAGPPWNRWGRKLLRGDETQRTFGPELERLVQKAKSEYLSKRPAAAIDLYAEAISQARQLKKPEVIDDLAYTRGSILLEMERYDEAVEQFRAIAPPAAMSARAASAHLLEAFALGKLYEQQKTQSRRETYTAALQEHLQRFSNDPTAADARFMYAALEEQRLQATQALPLYLAIPADHARGLAALAGAARCAEVIMQRLHANDRPWNEFYQDTREQLEARIQSFPRPADWTPEHGDALLSYGRFLLRADPPDYAATDRMLDAVLKHQGQSAAWNAVCMAALPLRLTTLAGTGKSPDARSLLDKVPTDPPQSLLTVVLGLDQLTAAQGGKETIELSRLFDDAVQRLSAVREKLTPAEQAAFDFAALRSTMRTGRWAVVTTQVEQLAKTFGKDSARLRQLAESLMQVDRLEAHRLAKQTWQRIEKNAVEGSPAWHSARQAVITQCLALGELDDAEKLLKLTRLLQVGDDRLNAEWDRLQERITVAKKNKQGEHHTQ